MARYSSPDKKRKARSAMGIFLLVSALLSFIAFYVIVMISQQGYHYIDPDTLEFVQIQEIPDGAPTAVIETSLGEIRAVLYPEYAPNTVSQFISLAEQGWYDNTYIFEAKNDVYFAAGSGDSAGTLKTPPVFDNQEKVPQELHQNLWPFRGALCSLTTSTDTSFSKRLFKNETYYTGSRFMFLNSVDFSDEEFVTQFREASGSEELANNFLKLGGVPNFSQQVTVFGQAYSGFDVIQQITSVQLAEEDNQQGYTPPLEEIKILSVKISSYSQEDAALNELSTIFSTN
ncbi:MAG: peptidylprolyl isomerase [Ruminococcus sp.]|nr:peptidylprolyl isomerase [Ruminococcus sp.]